MDNDGFKQQFKEKIKNDTVQQLATQKPKNNISLIVICILGFIVLVESIALIVILINSLGGVETIDVETEEVVAINEETDYIYDDDDNLISMNRICIAQDGEFFSFSTDDTFKKYDSAGTVLYSGSYSISDSFVIQLSPDNHDIYYNNISLADGTKIYSCEQETEEDYEEEE